MRVIRPHVIFDLVIERACVFANIENIGQTPANNVKVAITPALRCMFAGAAQQEQPEKGQSITFVERGIAMMAPGRSIKAFAEHFAPFSRAYPTLRFEGHVSYTDSSGKGYTESFVADLSSEEGLFYRGTKDIEDVATRLEQIALTLDNIATGFDKPAIRVINEEQIQAAQVSAIEKVNPLVEKRR